MLGAPEPRSFQSRRDDASGIDHSFRRCVVAFPRYVRQATGLDATEAMLAQTRKRAEQSAKQNVTWHRGDVLALPFADGTST
jgi:ubiquinone/menaquinone biosynthesis C-methylase UbiE